MKMPWQVSATAFYHIFCRYYTLFAIFRLHELRHTNATLLITGGVDVRTVAARLGHSQTSTTMNIYAETIRNAEAAAAQVLDDILISKKA